MSAAAYKLPLEYQAIPDGFEQIPIIVDGTKFSKNRPQNLLDKFQKLIAFSQYGLMFYKDGLLIVAYRGTGDLDNVMKDVTVQSVPYKCVPNYGLVHQGFQDVYISIRDSVLATIRAKDVKRVILTGHSMGGALSQLSAPDILYQFHSLVPEVINFAAPRCGQSEFANNFDRDIPTCYRVVNRWDGVPRVPAVWTGYRHVGKAIGINAGFKLPLQSHSLEGSYRPAMQKLVDAL